MSPPRVVGGALSYHCLYGCDLSFTRRYWGHHGRCLARSSFTTLYPWVYPTFFLIEKPRLAILLPAILDRVDSTCRPYPPRSLPSSLGLVANLLASRLATDGNVLYLIS